MLSCWSVDCCPLPPWWLYFIAAAFVENGCDPFGDKTCWKLYRTPAMMAESHLPQKDRGRLFLVQKLLSRPWAILFGFLSKTLWNSWGPHRPRSMDALITCFHTEARYKIHSFSQLPIFLFIHRYAPSLVALHLIPIWERCLLCCTQTMTQGSHVLFTLWSLVVILLKLDCDLA